MNAIHLQLYIYSQVQLSFQIFKNKLFSLVQIFLFFENVYTLGRPKKEGVACMYLFWSPMYSSPTVCIVCTPLLETWQKIEQEKSLRILINRFFHLVLFFVWILQLITDLIYENQLMGQQQRTGISTRSATTKRIQYR